jgi:hypothetical protein
MNGYTPGSSPTNVYEGFGNAANFLLTDPQSPLENAIVVATRPNIPERGNSGSLGLPGGGPFEDIELHLPVFRIGYSPLADFTMYQNRINRNWIEPVSGGIVDVDGSKTYTPGTHGRWGGPVSTPDGVFASLHSYQAYVHWGGSTQSRIPRVNGH